MNPFKGMTKEELLSEAQRYKHLCECFQKIDKTKSQRIRDLEAQLAALKEDAEVGRLVSELTTAYMGLNFESDGNGVSCFFADGESHADDLLGCVRVAHQIMVDEEEGWWHQSRER